MGRGWEEEAPARDNTTVAGFVSDLAEELVTSRVVVAPLLSGAGTKLKVLEGMASARPVVTTPVGAEGIPASQGVSVAREPAAFAAAILGWVNSSAAARAAGNANRVAVRGITWDAISRSALDRFESYGAGWTPGPGDRG